MIATRLHFGPGAAARKLALLGELEGASLASVRTLLAFHEHLLFLCAYPDSGALRARAERILRGFPRRSDLARFRDELIDSGIAGTTTRYPFFYPTARWLARRGPRRLVFDESDFEAEDEVERVRLLTAILPPAEALALRGEGATARAYLATALPRRTTAVALVERIAAAAGDDLLHEALHDRAAPYYRLLPGRGVPSRTLARAPGSVTVFRASPPSRSRPDLGAELLRPPRRIREVRGAAADELITLARDAMIVRARDLDCFAYADRRDVRRIELEDGLELLAFGSIPERRLLLSSAYGLLTVRNGIPVGYTQLDGFLNTALVHFNAFETFRGADAAWVFARTLAAARSLFGCSAFAIEPYQLGHGNDEALDSGAWWFYRKLGFVPRDPSTRRLARREERRMAQRPSHHSSRATLARLAQHHLYWEPSGESAVLPPHAAASRAINRQIASRSEEIGSARRRIAAEVGELLGVLPTSRMSPAERYWLARWAPFLLSLPGFRAWSPGERRALAAILRTKAGRRESDLPALARRHPRFRDALCSLAAREPASDS